MREKRSRKGTAYSEGARLLARALDKGLETHEDATRELGWSRGQIHKYVFGDIRPGRAHSLILERRYGIPPWSWDFAPKEEKVA